MQVSVTQLTHRVLAGQQSRWQSAPSLCYGSRGYPASSAPMSNALPQGAEVPPGAPGTLPDPAAITGPLWPRLVAADGTYTPPRLARWPIVVGILLFAGWVAALVIVPATVSSPSSGYALAASDAHFTATFPA